MLGYTPAGLHAEPRAPPPLLRSVAIAEASVFGSGPSDEESAATGCGAAPAAHGLGLTAAFPATRNALVPAVPHVVALCPDSSKPSAQTALVDPELAPATHEPPPPTHVCALAYTETLARSE